MSRQVGLRDLHVAILTADETATITYEKPVLLERSISAKITPSTSSDSIYSDDSLEEIIGTFSSIDVEFEVNTLSLESRKLLQGAKLTKGALVENKDDIAPDVAIGFRSKKSNGQFRYVWLLSGKFQITEDEYATVAEKPDPKTATIKGTFKPRNHDGNFRIIADSDGKTTLAGDELQTLIAGWFTAVPTIAADGTVTPGTAHS